MILQLLLAFSLGISAAAAPPAEAVTGFDDLHALSWLEGSWGDERTLEQWSDGDGGLMLGVHRDLRPGRSPFFEFLRIELQPDGTVIYFASPGGRSPATPFVLSQLNANLVVFSNPDNDFPKHISYELRANQVLVASIWADDRSQATTWTWPAKASGD